VLKELQRWYDGATAAAPSQAPGGYAIEEHVSKYNTRLAGQVVGLQT
jgi:hypothetical protein